MENIEDNNIRTLEWHEHIRLRTGMYIYKLGDGSSCDDGLYLLLKEMVNNSVDEHIMGFGNHISVTIKDGTVCVRDFGRGIPLGKLVEVVSKINTGGMYNSRLFKKSVGLNRVGIKVVNALSTLFEIRSIRNGEEKIATFSKGILTEETPVQPTDEPTGTIVRFTPDSSLFNGYAFRDEYVERLLKNYTYCYPDLTISFNGKTLYSRNGLLDLMHEKMIEKPLYPIIYLSGDDIEVAITHTNQNGEEYYSFVNAHQTTLGGTHLNALKESVARTLNKFFNRRFINPDILNGMVAAVAVKVVEPVFETCMRSKLGSCDMGFEGPTVAEYVSDFIQQKLFEYLHTTPGTADIILHKIKETVRVRKHQDIDPQ